MRLDDENGEITPGGWIAIAACFILFLGVVAWAVITLLLKLWMYLVML